MVETLGLFMAGRSLAGGLRGSTRVTPASQGASIGRTRLQPAGSPTFTASPRRGRCKGQAARQQQDHLVASLFRPQPG